MPQYDRHVHTYIEYLAAELVQKNSEEACRQGEYLSYAEVLATFTRKVEG
jgi:hypothetical protein